MSLAGKTIFISGGSRGIGLAVALRAARDGANLVVAAKTAEPHAHLPGTIYSAAEEIEAAGGKALPLVLDIRDEASVEAAMAQAAERFGGIDILINNAAEISDEQYDRVMDLNAWSVVAFMREVHPIMKKQGGGNIINTTSIAARNGGGGGAVLYAASKGFVSTFTRGMAKELWADKIRVNAVAPGVITTPFHERYSNAQQLEAMRLTVPMGYLAEAKECAGAFLFLASDSLSGYMIGQVIEVNGGQLMP